MSAEKMREEFEAWAVKHCDGLEIEDERDGDGYRHYTGDWWAAWQASRAAIEVELPEERVARGYGAQVADALGFNDGVGYCREAIESLGLKVKP